MVVAIHQPNYLPWLGFFHKMKRCDVFVLLDNVKHSKSSVTHRNKIKSVDSELLLSVSLKNKEELINELVILDAEKILHKHWASIESNYKKANHWSFLSEELSNIYSKNWERLVDLNMALIYLMKEKLSIECQILQSSDLDVQPGNGSDKNLNICKVLNADVYLSGSGAKVYNNEESFYKSGIKIIYNDFTHPTYPQLGNYFIPNLSAIDLLFNCGEKSKEYL